MLHNYLKGALSDLYSLIELTKADIEDIKIANNNSIFERNIQKQDLIKSFESKKSLIDQEMMSLKNQFPQKELAELIDDEASELLGEMKENLQNLKELNAKYARIVFAVSEFYSSLIQKIIPHEACDYKGNQKPRSGFLTLQV